MALKPRPIRAMAATPTRAPGPRRQKYGLGSAWRVVHPYSGMNTTTMATTASQSAAVRPVSNAGWNTSITR